MHFSFCFFHSLRETGKRRTSLLSESFSNRSSQSNSQQLSPGLAVVPGPSAALGRGLAEGPGDPTPVQTVPTRHSPAHRAQILALFPQDEVEVVGGVDGVVDVRLFRNLQL